MQSLDKKRNIIIICCSMSVYGFNRFFLKRILSNGYFEQLLKFHLNDFLGCIVLIALTNLLIIYNGKGIKKIESLFSCVGFSIICCVFWEGIAPLLLSYSTSDWKDCVAYLLGGCTYWVILKFMGYTKEYDKVTKYVEK